MAATLLVDGHVHYHACFGVAPFLEAALGNFDAARRERGAPDAVGCLMFAESAWSHSFRAFASGLVERDALGWTVTATREECALVARKDGQAPVVMIGGRQVATSERLEVLALGTVREFRDGLSFDATFDLVSTSGAVPVVPWGFGKWTGARGRIVEDLLASARSSRAFLGDNGGRPAVGGQPRLFEVARAAGIPILPGSDPLPLPPEVGKPGRFGFVLDGAFDEQAPAASIRALLERRLQPPSFGRLERLGTFVVRQAALRARRRSSRDNTDSSMASSSNE